MHPNSLKLPFAIWLKATEIVATADKTLSDKDLQAALNLSTLKAARQVRRQVRMALRNRAFVMPLTSPASGRRDHPAPRPDRAPQEKNRGTRPAVPPMIEWYAPHMT